MKRERKPTLPGEILKEFYLEPRKVTVTALAKALGCSRKHISNIIHGSARIEAEFAMRIAEVLGTTPELWLNLQNAVDIYEATERNKRWKPSQRFLDKGANTKDNRPSAP